MWFTATEPTSCLNDRLETRPFRDESMCSKTPQCNEQFAGQSHNANTPHALASVGKAFCEPPTQLASGLVAQPGPGNFNNECADPLISRLTNSLFPVTFTTVIGRWRQTR